jgi:hypothetical protein
VATLELRGDVPRPDEEAYDDARRTWNGMIDKRLGLRRRLRPLNGDINPSA